MPYVKLYTDILGDKKLLRAERQGHRWLCLTPWLLAFAKLAEDEGRLTVGGAPLALEEIATELAPDIPDATHRRLHECLTGLLEIQVLVRDDDGALRFTAWEARNGTSSEGRAAWRDRKRRQRARQAAAKPSREAPRDAFQGHAGHNHRSPVTVPHIEQEQEPEVLRSLEGRVLASEGAGATLGASLAPDLPQLSSAEIAAHEARRVRARATLAKLRGTV